MFFYSVHLKNKLAHILFFWWRDNQSQNECINSFCAKIFFTPISKPYFHTTPIIMLHEKKVTMITSADAKINEMI